MINTTSPAQTAPEAPKQARRRLSPAEQIAAAKEALARAQRRQRAHDTRSKVVLGGYVLSWARSNKQAAQSLLQQLNTNPPRDQDIEALADIRNELIKLVRQNANGASVNENA